VHFIDKRRKKTGNKLKNYEKKMFKNLLTMKIHAGGG
jgi:hypothetical protein